MATGEPNVRRALVQRLESLQRAGVRQLPRPVPGALPFASPASPAPLNEPPVVPPAPLTEENTEMPKRSVAPAKAAPSSGKLPVLPLAERRQLLDELNAEVKQCTLCSELVDNRTQTVFGVGNLEPSIVFFGEAPGADEDRLGEPFVGRAGQLLDKIIEAMTLKRADVYIMNVLKCRPPNNRPPEEQEAANCSRFYLRQLEILQPEFIVCLGASPSKYLLQSTLAVGKLRGKIHAWGKSRVVATYHPAYLLRNPAAKKDVWEDMQMLMKEMGLEIPKRAEG